MMIAFEGTAHCLQTRGAINLVLRGRWRGAQTEVLFSATTSGDVPPALSEARVIEIDAVPSGRRFRIESDQGRLEFKAQRVQVQRQVGAALFAVVPSPRVPLSVRAGWSVLLWALKLPGVGRLLLRSPQTSRGTS